MEEGTPLWLGVRVGGPVRCLPVCRSGDCGKAGETISLYKRACLVFPEVNPDDRSITPKEQK